MTRMVLLITHLLLLSTGISLGAPQCGQESIVVASHLRPMRTSQKSVNQAPDETICRGYFERFIEAVAARKDAAFCQDGAERRSALETLDAEIQALNDRIAEQSCVQ